jgi:hypothetical protein
VLIEEFLGSLLESSASVGVGMQSFRLHLQADELRASGIAVLLDAVGIRKPRRVVARVSDDCR